MEQKEIKSYIDELEAQLYEWDDGPINWQLELETLQNTIKVLMDKTFESTNPDEKTYLAALEYRARRCRDCILRRNMMKN